MYLKGPMGARYRYDVIINGPITNELYTIWKWTAGSVVRRNASKVFLGVKKEVTKFTPFQMLLWQAVVIGTSTKCNIRYSVNPLLGKSCYSWTIGAILKAKLISRLAI
jgi:hypothetical protein